MPRRLTISLTPLVIARLQQRRAEGISLTVLAAEVDVSATMLRRRLREVKPSSAGQPSTRPVTKAHRTGSVPMKRRAASSRPASPEPSKQRLRDMITQAVRNTRHH